MKIHEFFYSQCVQAASSEMEATNSIICIIKTLGAMESILLLLYFAKVVCTLAADVYHRSI